MGSGASGPSGSRAEPWPSFMITLAADHRFGLTRPGNNLLRQGWAAPEEGFVWAIGRRATLVLPPAEGPGRLVLELTVDPFRHPPHMRHQRLRVSINDEVLGDRRLGGRLAWWLEVPADAASGPLRVTLDQPNATSPRALGANPDDRKLGFRLSAAKLLRVRSAARPALGVTEIRFGWNETTEGWLAEGFGEPEDRFVWALGQRSVLRLPVDGSGQPVLAVLGMRPFLDPPHAERQRLVIGQDGRLLTYLDLRIHAALALRLTPQKGQRSVVLQFDHLDAEVGGVRLRHDSGRPFAFGLDTVRLFPAPPPHVPAARERIDGRLADGSLATRVCALTGLELAELAGRFECFGNACNLGLLQQQLGCDQPGLLRFAGWWQPELVTSLLHGFVGLGRPDALHFALLHGLEANWRMIEEVYSFRIPTPYSPFAPPPDNAKALAGRIYPRLAEKLLEDAAEGSKIFAFRAEERLIEAGAVALRAALGALGDVTILWLMDGSEEQRGGVERIGHRLLRGYATANLDEPEQLVSVLANAWILSVEERGHPPIVQTDGNRRRIGSSAGSQAVATIEATLA